MPVEQRSTYDNDGAYVRIVEFQNEDTDINRVVVRAPPDSDVMVVSGYDGDDAVVYEQSFEMRELNFDPISAVGRGEKSRMTGATTNDTEDDDGDDGQLDAVPRDVETALNGIGFAIVPDGEWWLNE